MTTSRLRRPVPERTEPKRGILGLFGQTDWRAGSTPQGHPLGPGFIEPAMPDDPALDYIDEQVREATEVADKHIQQVVRERAEQDDGMLGTIAALYAGTSGADLTTIVATLTRAYADLAGKWVDIATGLTEQLGQMRSKSAAESGGLGAAGPVLSLKAAVPVEARVEMFRAAIALSAQPLGSDDPAISARITDVTVADGRLRIVVPADQPPGTYYGLLLEDGAGPAGVVTVAVLAEDET